MYGARAVMRAAPQEDRRPRQDQGMESAARLATGWPGPAKGDRTCAQTPRRARRKGIRKGSSGRTSRDLPHGSHAVHGVAHPALHRLALSAMPQLVASHDPLRELGVERHPRLPVDEAVGARVGVARKPADALLHQLLRTLTVLPCRVRVARQHVAGADRVTCGAAAAVVLGAGHFAPPTLARAARKSSACAGSPKPASAMSRSRRLARRDASISSATA